MFFAEDLLRLVGEYFDCARLAHWHSQCVLRLVIELSTRVNNRPRMNLNSNRSDKLALKLVCVDEERHRLNTHCIAGAASHREYGCVFDHVGVALGVRKIYLQAWMVDLEEWRQAHLVVALLWLVEAESVVDWRH